MEYERIHKVQTGLISPSKLRMKLTGANRQRNKDEGSNCNSSRTSPSRLEDAEFVRNGLLAAQSGDFDEEASNLEVTPVSLSGNSGENSLHPKENGDANRSKILLSAKPDHSTSSSAVHPVRIGEDENFDYDSTSSFEFHRGERSVHHSLTRSFSKPMSSKWNDAEKWIMSRQNVQPHISNFKKAYSQTLANRVPAMHMFRVAPESANYENKSSVKRVDCCQPAMDIGSDKFALVENGSYHVSGQGNAGSVPIDLCPESRDLMEVDDKSLCTKSSTDNTTGISNIKTVSMRDMGTEMTPIPSQEPSRTATPVGATTPLRSPTSSIPSTPRRDDPAPTPDVDATSQYSTEDRRKVTSEEELKLKTRREIVALGVQLGKMSIAAWASNDDKERRSSAADAVDTSELDLVEFSKRAAAWEEVEKSKHTARFKREEIKIQAWESREKAKLDTEMRKTEALVEQMRAQAHAKMVKKIAMARQRSDEKRAAAEARKNRQAEKTAAQVEYIRQTGQLPSSSFVCCGWS